MTHVKDQPYRGIFVALNSGYDHDGNISPSAIKKNTRFLADKGVQGLYVGGSSGEGFLQTLDERKQVLEAVMEEVGGELTVIAQVGAIATRDSVELAKHANSLNVDAISSVPPFYYKVSDAAVEKHWLTIIHSTPLPFIIYHIPATTGFQLSMDLFRKMAAYDQVAGLKITTASTYELQQFKRFGGEGFTVFNGPDEQYLAGRIMGADAGIGGTYGIMPELFVNIEKAYVKGEIAEAQKWQFAVNEILSDLLSLPVYGAIKEILKLRGLDCGGTRMPLEPVSTDDLPKVKSIYDKIMQWVASS